LCHGGSVNIRPHICTLMQRRARRRATINVVDFSDVTTCQNMVDVSDVTTFQNIRKVSEHMYPDKNVM